MPLIIFMSGIWAASWARADDPNIIEGPSYGYGEDWYRVAVINDIHIGGDYYGSPGWNDHFQGDEGEAAVRLRNCVSWINAHHTQENIKLVVLVGDITLNAQISEFEKAKEILSQVEVPYLPLVGNHDIWPYSKVSPGDTYSNAPEVVNDSGADQWFDWFWSPVCDSVLSYARDQGIIRNVHKMPSQRWNWYSDFILYPPQLEPLRYSFLQDLSFDMGPEDNPFHFLCLDFCGREKSPTLFGKENPGGSFDADDAHLDFNDMTRSVRVRGNVGDLGYIDLYKAINYQGDCRRIHVSQILDTMAEDWDSKASSVICNDCITSATLFNEQYQVGDKRVNLYAGESVPDLRSFGHENWWHRDIENCPVLGDKNVLVFSHFPLTVDYGVFGGGGPKGPKDGFIGWGCFQDPEYSRITSFLWPYRRSIAGWICGHLHQDTLTYVPGTHEWLYVTKPVDHHMHVRDAGHLDSSLICDNFVGYSCCGGQCVPPSANTGFVNLLTFYYPVAQYSRIIDLADAEVVPNPFDPTRDDSARVCFKVINGGGNLTIGVYVRNVCVRTLAQDQYFGDSSEPYSVAWDGRKTDGTLVEPTDECYLRFSKQGAFEGSVPVTIKGTVVAPGLSVAGRWLPERGPYVLSGGIVVPPNCTLRVDSGTAIMPKGSSSILVEGSLIVGNNVLDATRFTPYRRILPIADPASPGAWQGIRIDDHAGACCSLDHCIIEYAGNPVGGDSAAIVCNQQGGLSLTNSVVRYSSTRGFWARSSINNNDVLLRGDTFEHIAGYPASVLAESVGAVVNSCTFRNNANPALDVRVSSNHWVDQSANWRCCEPGWRYDINGMLYVHKPYGPSCCSLMVGHGATIRLGQGHKLEIGLDNTSRTGYLGAWSQGARIRFTSLDTVNPGNWWSGIQLGSDSRADMESCDVSCSQDAGVKVVHSALLQSWYSTFRRSQCGVDLASGNASTLWAWVCQFAQNDIGVKLTGGDDANTIIQYCLFAGNSSYGLYADADQYMQLYWNWFTNNGIPVRLRANLVYPLLCNNYFPANTWRGIEENA